MNFLALGLGFAVGFSVMLWLFPMGYEGISGGRPPWWAPFPVAIAGGLVAVGIWDDALGKIRRRARKNEIIRRAQLKQAREYRANRKDSRAAAEPLY